MPNFQRRFPLSLLAVAMASAALAPQRAAAETSTVAIVTNTIAAFPSCVKYEVKGACFFLFCVPYYCEIKYSIRVSHNVPDVIISTYHDPLAHPWTEVGKPLATALQSAGSALMRAPIDSSGSTHRESTEISTFKSADAIGNPAGMILQMLQEGSVPNFGDSFGFPGYEELMAFPSRELPNIVRAWAQVPQQAGNELMESARRMANASGNLMSGISSFPSSLGGLTSSLGGLGDLFGGSMSTDSLTGSTGMQTPSLGGTDLGPVQDLAAYAQGASDGSLSDLICPGAASAFTLHYQSDMDAPFWRSLIPLEMLYPQSWIPGLSEVSTSGFVNTWGSTYPRIGDVVQSHPVKASAVLASRVGSIIKKRAQPHIYKYLQPKSGYRYFPTRDQDVAWQMLSPIPEQTCHTFGTNDAVSLGSFGDYKTDEASGYTWNMWNRYDCCRIRGAFLFAVP